MITYVNPDSIKDQSIDWSKLKNIPEFTPASDHVIGKGDVENSAVLKNLNNIAISEGSIALGNSNIAGLKGWYYGSINKIDDRTIDVYISDSQRGVLNYPTWGGTTKISNLNPYEVLGPGLVVSLINDVKYDNKFEVIEGEAGRIRLQTVSGNLPFSSIATKLVLDPEDYSIYCLSMPTAGVVDVSLSSIAEGRSTKALGACSHAEGYNTTASGDYSHAEGSFTAASGECSHAEGNDTLAEGVSSHAEGWGTRAYNHFEHSEGKYNKSNDNTIHSVGIGASDTDRKNAHEITNDGKHYIYGIGDYDGTNAVTPNANGIIAKSVQEVINDNFGGIIIVEHSDTLSKNYVIDVYNKISDAILSGKIYTIYVDNKTDKTIYGNIQVSAICSNNVHLSHTIMHPDGSVYIHRHTYHANGQYEFVK